MTEEKTNFASVIEELQKGQRNLKAFENAEKTIKVLQAAEQTENEYKASIAKKQDEIVELDEKINKANDALTEAGELSESIVADAHKQAAKTIEESKSQVDHLTAQYKQLQNSVAEEEKKLGILSNKIDDAEKELEAVSQKIADQKAAFAKSVSSL